jgi:hypothetical protein
MLADLERDRVAVPEWLMKASAEDRLPLREILTRSMFYPACGFDGRAVQYFAGAVHSFVYVDFTCRCEDVLENLSTFKGYRVVFAKDIEQNSLGIKSFEPHQNILSDNNRFDNDNYPYFSYAIWAVFERLEEFSPGHGPERFSLLYIGGEAISVYWSLYWRRRMTPFSITLIRSDGFTNNWTAFLNDKLELASLVMFAEWGRPPKYLFCGHGGRDAISPWRWYRKMVTTFHSSLDYGGDHHEHLNVWEYSPLTQHSVIEERIRTGRAWTAVRAEISGNTENRRENRVLIERAEWSRRVVEKLLNHRINPLKAVFFKSRLSPGCIDLNCSTCGGKPLRKHLDLLSKSEILSDLGRLDYELAHRYEMEIRSTLMYVDAGHLTTDEIWQIRERGAGNILDRMIAHYALRLERARTVARLERERYLKARQVRSELATERLPNALRRKDSRAVHALLRKKANPDYVQFDGNTARLVARKLGIENWLPPIRQFVY